MHPESIYCSSSSRPSTARIAHAHQNIFMNLLLYTRTRATDNQRARKRARCVRSVHILTAMRAVSLSLYIGILYTPSHARASSFLSYLSFTAAQRLFSFALWRCIGIYIYARERHRERECVKGRSRMIYVTGVYIHAARVISLSLWNERKYRRSSARGAAVCISSGELSCLIQ